MGRGEGKSGGAAVAGRGSLAALAALAAVAGTLAAARAEFARSGKLLVSFDAGMRPSKLPRSRLAPVEVGFRGTFENLDASDTPALRTMTVLLSRGGRIDRAGLPRCPRRRLRDADSARALRVCGAARVGDGTVRSAFRFPDGRRGRARAKMLLFNAPGGLLMHVYATEPLRGTFLVPISVRRRRGAFGTVLTARFPKIAAGYGYLTGFEMVIDRTFRRRGRRQGYALASCPLPRGFGRRLVFELARVTYRFRTGVTVRNSAVRSCRVRGGG